MLIGLRGAMTRASEEKLTLVEYLKCTHTSRYYSAYFDTGFVLTGNTALMRIEIDGVLTFGYAHNGNTSGLWYIMSNAGTESSPAVYVRGGAMSPLVNPSGKGDGKWVIAGSSVTFNGSSVGTVGTKTGVAPGVSMPIFCYYDIRAGGYSWYEGSTDIIRQMKIFYNDELKVHLVPCRNSTGEGMLYDLVNEETKKNLGYGDVMVGPDSLSC